MLGHSCPVLSVEVGVNFVKYVEGGWVRSLDGEDEGEGAKTFEMLARFFRIDGREIYSFALHLIAGSAAAHHVYC